MRIEEATGAVTEFVVGDDDLIKSFTDADGPPARGGEQAPWAEQVQLARGTPRRW